MPLNASQEQCLLDIDWQIKKILLDGGDRALLLSLYAFTGDLKKIMDACSHEELDEYCKKYKGFFHCMKLIENISRGIADGSIPALP